MGVPRNAALFLLVAASMAPAAAPPPPGDGGDPKGDLGALIALAEEGIRDDYEGPSPTTLARRILERKEKATRALLEEAWKRSDGVKHPATDYSNGIRQVAEYLYGLEKPSGPPVPKGSIGFGATPGVVREVGGLVLVRPGGSGERPRVMGEKGWDREGPDPRPAMAALLKGGKWRKAPRPDVKALVKMLDGEAMKDWSDPEKESFLLGLGEACGADAGNRPLLLRAFEDDPADAGLARAVGRAGTPDAAAALRARIAPLAAKVAEGKEAAIPLLQAAAKGLCRIDPAAFSEELGKLEGAEEEAVLRGVGFRLASGILCDRHDGADAGGKRSAVLSMVRLVLLAHFSREFPEGERMRRVVGAWTAALDAGDPELAEWVDRGAYGLFYMGWRDGEAHMIFSSNDVAVNATGARPGPNPPASPLLRRLDQDRRAGNLSFAGREPGPFDVSPPPGGGDSTARDLGRDFAWSGVRCPIPSYAEADPASPWHLSSEKTDEGLRLTLTFKGKGKAALDPVAFRYVCAEYLPVRVTGVPGGPKEFTYLKLDLGPLGGWRGWRVPADRLKVLAPGESFAFDVAVAPEHRDATHVSIELSDTFAVIGESPAPVLHDLGWSWVR